MRNKAFSLVEILVVAGIGMGVAAVIFSAFIIMNTGMIQNSMHSGLKQKAQISLSFLQNYLEKADPDTIQISACTPGQCNGDKITFQVPIVNNDAVAGTAFTNYGSLKLGAYYSSGGINYTVRNAFFDIYANDNNKLVLDAWQWVEVGQPPPPPPPPGNPGCFLAGTPVLMADDSTKPIEQIKPGDNVWAYNEKTGKNEKNTVTKLLIHKAKRYLIINGALKVTPEHRFYYEGKWVKIGALKIGDKLFNFKGQTEEIKSIERKNERVTVYNLTVNPAHTYFVTGLLVHNAKLPGDQVLPGGGDLWGRLFNDFLGVKEAYAGLVKQILNSSIICAENVKQAKFIANATKTLITVQLQLEKTGLAGEPVFYEAETQIAPLIN
ncbi:MAG: hypothetical protein FJZ10_00285 [Candidatus Omnitrophica bacterium]|nr:hypothetical protein [Candidatus Omnitrophota bacterium]